MMDYELERVIDSLYQAIHEHIISLILEETDGITCKGFRELHKETEPLHKILDAIKEYKEKKDD